MIPKDVSVVKFPPAVYGRWDEKMGTKVKRGAYNPSIAIPVTMIVACE